MQQAITAEGVEKVLTEDCGLLPHEDLARAVKSAWARLVNDKAQGRHREFAMGVETSLDVIAQNVMRDLSGQYDPRLVKAVVTRVADEFRDARVWNYVPILLKRRAAEHLNDSSNDIPAGLQHRANLARL